MAVLFTDEELEQKYFGQTAFSISHRVLNPVTAIQEALKQHRNNHALEPPQKCPFWLFGSFKEINYFHSGPL